MFEVGIYKRSDRTDSSRVLLVRSKEGFIFKNKKYKIASYSNDWIKEYSVLDDNFMLNEDEIINLRKREEYKAYSKEIEAYIKKRNINFGIKGEFLVSENNKDFIRISSLDRIIEVEINMLLISYNATETNIKCKEIEKLKKILINPNVF